MSSVSVGWIFLDQSITRDAECRVYQSGGYFQVKVLHETRSVECISRVDISRSKYYTRRGVSSVSVGWIFLDQSITRDAECRVYQSGGYFQIKVLHETRSVECIGRVDISRSKYYTRRGVSSVSVGWIFPDQSITRDFECRVYQSGGYFQIKVLHETRSVECDA